MRNSVSTLNSIIQDEFDGRKKKLAEKSKLPASYITRLTKHQSFTPQTLEQVCKCLKKSSAEKLCLAVAKDILPQNFHLSINYKKEDPFYGLDPETQKIIFNLAELCSKDEGTREWLHQLSTWMFDD